MNDKMITITITEDILDHIKKYPHAFYNNLVAALNETGCDSEIIDLPIPGTKNFMEVAKSHNADEPKLYLSHNYYTTSIGGIDSFELEIRSKRLEIAKELIKKEEAEITKLSKIQLGA